MNPNSKPTHYRTCGDVSVTAGRESGQEAWYRFVAPRLSGKRVLDVGCGLGAGLSILLAHGCRAEGQDLDQRLQRPGVTIGPTSIFPSSSFDYITCIDVIEHIEDDREFLFELMRIARRGLFMTTPLAICSRPLWPYHVREYTFPQFVRLTENFGECEYFKGTSSGEEVHAIHDLRALKNLSYWLNNPVTNVFARLANKLLPRRLQNMGHQAVLVTR
jgi:SAM-dependent methyltransferase